MQPRSKVKVRHLSSVHDIGDTRIVHKECCSLQRSGFDVALIACHDGDDTVSGVPVLGIGSAHGRLDRMTRKAWQMFRRALREHAQIYHFHDPELILVGLGLRLLGKRVIFDAHEDVPKQIMNKPWIPGLLRRPVSFAVRVMEQLAGAKLSAIVAATPSIAEKFPPAKTVVCQNFPEAGLAGERNEVPFEERTNDFVYVGQLIRDQGVYEMVEMLGKVPDGVHGVFAGKLREPRAVLAAMPGWRKVDYVGLLDRKGVVDVLRQGRVGLVIDHPISNFLDGYSTKMFEYMACGIPFIASDFPLWVEIVAQAQCGVTLDPRDTDAVAAALMRYLDDPELAASHGENGRQAILTRYNWDVEYAKLLDCYEGLL
jgi:glycosyltransferase involved in cell wall biosynthesis